MNRKRSKSKKRVTVNTWTLEGAKKAAPYIANIVESLREQHLAVRSHRRHAERLHNRPGRADRSVLIAEADANSQALKAEAGFDEAMAELNALHIYTLDPLRGEAFVPFVHADKLAWFVFDAFTPEDHIQQWRYHDDPLEARRPLAEALIQPLPV